MTTPPSEPQPVGDRPTDAPAPVSIGPADTPPPVSGRLHPAVVGVWAFNAVGPAIVFTLTGAIGGVLIGGLVGMSVLAGLVRYQLFSWRVEGSTFVIEQGWIQRQRRVIPFDRIQSVEVVRRLRHRLFGVVELRIETVGGGKAEGRLDALSPDDAEWLRATLLRRDAVAPQAPAADTAAPLVTMSPSGLVVAGLTGGRVGIAAALLGFGQDFIGGRLERWLPALDPTGDPTGLVVVVASVLAGAFLLSIAATVLTYWNFTVTVDGEALRVRRGLLEQRTDTLPLRRIQSLRIEQNLLRRMLGLAAVKVEVAGRAGGDEGRLAAFLLPLGRVAEARELIRQVLGHDLPSGALAPMPTGARDRRLVRALLFTALVTVAAVWRWGPPGLAAVLTIGPAAAAAIAAYRSLGWALDERLVVARAGWLVRRTSFVRRNRLQSLELSQSPFQRRRALASLSLQIARSGGGPGDPVLVDLAQDDTLRLLDTLMLRTPVADRG